MILMEYIERKQKELGQVNQKVEFKGDAREVKMGKNCISFAVFSAPIVPLDAELIGNGEATPDTLPKDNATENMVPAAAITFSVIPPRCRKPRKETFYALLQQEVTPNA